MKRHMNCPSSPLRSLSNFSAPFLCPFRNPQSSPRSSTLALFPLISTHAPPPSFLLRPSFLSFLPVPPTFPSLLHPSSLPLYPSLSRPSSPVPPPSFLIRSSPVPPTPSDLRPSSQSLLRLSPSRLSSSLLFIPHRPLIAACAPQSSPLRAGGFHRRGEAY